MHAGHKEGNYKHPALAESETLLRQSFYDPGKRKTLAE